MEVISVEPVQAISTTTVTESTITLSRAFTLGPAPANTTASTSWTSTSISTTDKETRPFQYQNTTRMFHPISTTSMGNPSQSIDPSQSAPASLSQSSPPDNSAIPPSPTWPVATPLPVTPSRTITKIVLTKPTFPAGTLGGIIISGFNCPPGLATTTTTLTTTSPTSITAIAITTTSHPSFTGSSTWPSTGFGGIIYSAFNGPGATTTLGTSLAYALGSELAASITAFSPAPTRTPALFTIGTQTATILPSATAMLIGGSTVLAGGPAVTIDGQVISMLPSGSGVAVNGATTLRLPAQPADTEITIGTAVATALDASDVVIGGTTLRPGSAPLTVGGQVVSLASGGTLLVGSSTVLLPVWAQATGYRTAIPTGTGTATWTYLGPNGTAPAITPFKGGANGRAQRRRGVMWMGVGLGAWLSL
ncbi:hypothetical protein MMC30_000450 [Trapelia coarctata]|nr:hypothetical protein [Trapelia coarctata]